MRATTGRSAAIHPTERVTRVRSALSTRLVLALVGVLASFLLIAGNAGAVAPTLEGSFTGPEGGSAGPLAVNEKTGEIFVLDEPKDAVDRYTSAGVLIEEIEGSKTKAGTFYFGNATYDKIAVDNSSGSGQGTVYISAPKEGGHIFALKLETGVYKELWEVSPGYKPNGLAVDKFGNPWFTFFPSSLVFELEPSSGAIVGGFETAGVEDEAIAFDSEDHMFAAARYEGRIVEFDPVTGKSLNAVFIRDPEDIAIDPSTNWRFVTTETWLESMSPAGFAAEGTPFFANSGTVAVNGVARKVYTASGNEVKVWRIPAVLPLTVSKVGGGSSSVVSAPGGIDCGSVCSTTFDEGEVVVLTAVPESGVVVSGWKGCVYEPSPDECEVSVDHASEVSVGFAKAVSLTVSKSGSGTVSSVPAGIKCGVHCSVPFAEGSTVVLMANVPPGDTVSWRGCMAEPVADECEVTLDEARSVSVTFSTVMYGLAVAKTGSGSGTITCNGVPCLSEYPVGSTIELGGIPASGSAFVGFSGDGCSETTCDLVIQGDVSVTAAFNRVLSAGVLVPSSPVWPSAGESKPVVRTARCGRGYVRHRANGRARCVRVKKRGKSKKHR